MLVRIIEWPELSDTFNYFCCLFFVFKHWYFYSSKLKNCISIFTSDLDFHMSCFHCDSFTDFTINTINLLSFELLVSLGVCIQAPSLYSSTIFVTVQDKPNKVLDGVLKMGSSGLHCTRWDKHWSWTIQAVAMSQVLSWALVSPRLAVSFRELS